MCIERIIFCLSFIHSFIHLQSQYEKHKEVSTAQGVKILGKDLEKALAGLPLLVAHKEDEVPVLRVRRRRRQRRPVFYTWGRP